MKRVSTAIPFTAAFTLMAACAGNPPAGSAPPSSGSCSAGHAQFAVGRPLTPDLEKEAQARSGAGVVRVIRPGQMVTMEYSEHRLNIEVDAGGRVIRVRCG